MWCSAKFAKTDRGGGVEGEILFGSKLTDQSAEDLEALDKVDTAPP